MKEIILNRKQLYDMVWSEPITSLSKKYCLTDSELRKICLNLSIPLPKAGYWQKLRNGKKADIDILETISSGEQEIKLSEREIGDKDIIRLSPLEILQKEIESDTKLPLVVPEKLSNPDKLIMEARDNLKEKVSTSWRKEENISCSSQKLDISVSRQNVMRGLCFMDTFIKLLRARGHNIIVEIQGTFAIIEGEKIKVRLREKTKKVIVKDSWEHTEYHSTGVLTFKIEKYSWQEIEWKDGKQLIEEQLSKILAKLELESKRLKLERQEYQKRLEEQNERERILREIEQRKERELYAFKELLQDAERWRKVTLLRNYINEMEARALENGTISEEAKNWLAWARKKVDWYDPYINSLDTLLEDIDKETLTKKKKVNSFYH